MNNDQSSNVNQIRMDSLTEVLRAIAAPARGSGAAVYLQRLPRTRQDLALEEPSRGAQGSLKPQVQGSASHPRVTLTSATVTTITTPTRKETLGSSLSGRILYDDELDEPHEEQQNSATAQDSKIDLPVDNSNQEEELPLKYPIAPQYCRRWAKPESYVISDFSTTLSDEMRG